MTMFNESQTIFSSLLASSLLVGMPSALIGAQEKDVTQRQSSTHHFVVHCTVSLLYHKLLGQNHSSGQLIEFLKMGDRSSKELANLTKTNERNLSRLLYRLTNEGYLIYNEKDGRYSINKQTLTLFEQRHFMGMTYERPYQNINHQQQQQQQQQQPQRNNIITSPMGSGVGQGADCNNLAVRDGADIINPSSPNLVGQSPFQQQQPAPSVLNGTWSDERDVYLKRLFEAAMKQKNELNKLHQDIANCFNFSRFKHLCDLGGGFGYLGFQILRRHPQCEIIVLETEEAVKHGMEISSNDPQKKILLDDNKINFKIGDIFQPRTVPIVSGYILMQILCIWNDDDCRRILSSVATIMRKEKNQSGSSPSLIIIDYISQDQNNLDFNNNNNNNSSNNNNRNNSSNNSNECKKNGQNAGSANENSNGLSSCQQQQQQQVINKTTSMDIVMIGIVGCDQRNQAQWDTLFRESGLSIQQCNKVPHQITEYSSSTTENLFLMELVHACTLWSKGVGTDRQRAQAAVAADGLAKEDGALRTHLRVDRNVKVCKGGVLADGLSDGLRTRCTNIVKGKRQKGELLVGGQDLGNVGRALVANVVAAQVEVRQRRAVLHRERHGLHSLVSKLVSRQVERLHARAQLDALGNMLDAVVGQLGVAKVECCQLRMLLDRLADDLAVLVAQVVLGVVDVGQSDVLGNRLADEIDALDAKPVFRQAQHLERLVGLDCLCQRLAALESDAVLRQVQARQ
ncbi:O-methyltransferase family 2 protein [Cavenderia fasciculata]|uniref:O-methyltransferase family 2 protein n=1 Tax=Cavenderia fasciculata TaxID=261658 RepID=F4QEA9_CACFS|nr:O-methyltransferase family 2 protein [Cavenderia fasciculata]EGG14056.1 O-methyltransferase family 2 protein [Cavenderia fasciculata]|eukprot:XP_004350764.1 O-methyltransferase family 2 protein [Cavenderia fasciculata]